jgi:hypothetical protein
MVILTHGHRLQYNDQRRLMRWNGLGTTAGHTRSKTVEKKT